MYNYKDFRKVYLGTSDIARLILVGTNDCQFLDFGGDDEYSAYLIPQNCPLASHYHEVARFNTRVSIYDDTQLRLEISRNPNVSDEVIRIYRAGDYGCAIRIPIGSEIRKGAYNDNPYTPALITRKPLEYKWMPGNSAPLGLRSEDASVIKLSSPYDL
jgi:hypothetical protein